MEGIYNLPESLTHRPLEGIHHSQLGKYEEKEEKPDVPISSGRYIIRGLENKQKEKYKLHKIKTAIGVDLASLSTGLGVNGGQKFLTFGGIKFPS